QLASRDDVPAARAAVARQAPRDAQVVETTPEAAQARRAALGPKGAAVVAKAKERATRPPKKTPKRKVDDEETRADDQER
ncbi:hypothetical protein LPQ06_28405, partial [Klebsiella pneumoniae]|nr:hypothetical protein [Klebsiella pneumoniae]